MAGAFQGGREHLVTQEHVEVTLTGGRVLTVKQPPHDLYNAREDGAQNSAGLLAEGGVGPGDVGGSVREHGCGLSVRLLRGGVDSWLGAGSSSLVPPPRRFGGDGRGVSWGVDGAGRVRGGGRTSSFRFAPLT